MGILEHSTSSWSILNVFVPKSDGVLITTSDFRPPKAMKETEFFPVEHTKNAMDRLSKKSKFRFDRWILPRSIRGRLSTFDGW